MWQLVTIASLVSTAFENVADKYALVREKKIDPVVATFWRNALFYLFTLIVGYFGALGHIRWYFDPWIVLFSIGAVVSGLAYTYMLKRVEVMGVQMEMFLMPLIFLAIDAVYIHVPLTATQVAGIVLLPMGGLLLTIDARTRRVKREFSAIVWGILFYWMVFDGFEYYLFKHLNTSIGLNGVSFFASSYAIVVLALLCIVVARGDLKRLFSRSTAHYLPAITVSKMLDTGATLLWMTALSMAAVSQVSAVGALEPLILFLVAVFVQIETPFNIKERVDGANFRWKAFAVALLCAGTLLVS